MRGFELDRDTGDVVIENGEIRFIAGADLEAQNLAKLINTNKGEWWLDEGEGIDFSAVLTKAPNYDRIQNEIQAALLRVDDTLVLQTFSHTLAGRSLTVRFTAKNAAGAVVEVETALQ